MTHVYRQTKGVSETNVKGEASFRLVELGGRSLTTPKLLQFFDNVNAVMFLASCAEVEKRLVREYVSQPAPPNARASLDSSK